MPRKGWIKLHRSLLDNPMWEEKPFSKGQAWVDLLLLAESEEKDISIAGIGIHQKPGGVYWPKKSLMARWGWSRWRLDNVLQEWEADGMITVEQHRNQHRNQHRTVTEITVGKWRFFQGRAKKTSTETDTENDILLKNNNKKGGGDGSAPRPAKKKTVLVDGHWEVVDA